MMQDEQMLRICAKVVPYRMEAQGFAISMVYPIMKTMAQKGLEFREFCRHVSFDIDLLDDVEARIDEMELERLMKEAAVYTNDENFGLHQGELTDIADLGILGYVMMHSEKVVDALKAYQRHNVILCYGYQLDWKERGDDVYFRFYKLNGAPMSRQCLDDMVSSVYHLMVRMTNRRIPVYELQFTYEAPADTGAYLSIFGVEPAFGGKEVLLRMDKKVLQFPILYSNQRLLRAFEPIAEEIKNKLILGRQFSDRVFQWMMAYISSDLPTLQQTAESFKMSPRSMQAKLSEEGTTYHNLLAAVRMEMARSYLNQKDYSISEVAYLLHYSEPSAFHNAFRKWTGMTPGQYRADAVSSSKAVSNAH